MKLIYPIFLALALLTGVAIGYIYNPDVAATPPPAANGPAAAQIANIGDKATTDALRRRIAELEGELAQMKRNPPAAATTGAVAVAENADAGRRNRSPFGNFREEMARLKTENPERYASITNHIARMRERRFDRARSRIEFLSSIDTSRMSVTAREKHDELQELIIRREELEEKMHDETLDDTARREIFEEMRESGRKMHELCQIERENLIKQTAESLGFEGEDVGEIALTMKEIIDATDNAARFGPPPGGPGGGRGFGGGFGRPPR